MRGNPAYGDAPDGDAGSIPACAGEPSGTARGPVPPRVYPRVCGGTQPVFLRGSLYPGLSPRVRGNHGLVRQYHVRERSIPACAGEPPRRKVTAPGAEVYPRVCGGTCATSLKATSRQRSIPAGAGNQRLPPPKPPGERSIPACAGEPNPLGPNPLYLRVYPRVCGGTPAQGGFRRGFRGLSPRVRGNLTSGSSGGNWSRSIPACAGGTEKEHPNGTLDYGLSPRVRGNRV